MFKKLLNVFKNTSEIPNILSENSSKVLTYADGWYLPLPANKLLETPLRQQYLKKIWQNVSMSPDMFNKLYQEPIEKYAEIVQLLPASESHHHSHVGGMLDHGLEVISIAVKLRQSYVLPQNIAPEEQAKQRDVWTAIVFYAALLHDIGKVAVDIEVSLKSGKKWCPWISILKEPYKFRYIERDYELHSKIGSVLATKIIPYEAFEWIGEYRNALASLLYFISGHLDKAGILSEIIQKADQISVTMALGGDISKISEKPQISFAKQLSIALKHVINNYKLNAPKGGCDGWLTENGLFVMSKSTADSIRAYLIQQGISVPTQNGRLFDELQAHQLIESTSENNAVWNCKIISNIGWAPPKPFTLLKIDPTKIWDKIENRPALFKGKLIIVDQNGLDISLEQTENIEEIRGSNISVTQSAIQDAEIIDTNTKAINNEALSSSSSIDEVLNLFPMGDSITPIENEENCSYDGTKEQITKPAPIKIDEFINWIKQGIISNTLVMNKPNAKLHIVEKHLFLVTPSIFQLFLIEKTGNTSQDVLESLQKQFQNLGIHKRQYIDNDGRNIWTCSIIGKKGKSLLNGYLIEDVEYFLGQKQVYNNHWLQLQGTINDI
ncbi:MobH family relaxase [Pasteurella oralis]|uniref:MobH family relaxase n=1 Tax=Pasteurella oralis TaxID=1071947 RepID=UPI000C7E49C7|nr:MobH family relaxase [Pasteurella oralis]